MVGRICNLHQRHAYVRGEEKGYFEYGGSTIIMLLKKGMTRLDADFRGCERGAREIPVRLGERIGSRSDG